MDISKSKFLGKTVKASKKLLEKFDFYLAKIKKETLHGDELDKLYADKSPAGRKKYKEYLKELEKK